MDEYWEHVIAVVKTSIGGDPRKAAEMAYCAFVDIGQSALDRPEHAHEVAEAWTLILAEFKPPEEAEDGTNP